MPGWMYLFSVFMAFMYQTLDAVDGKQARRTGSSSPLGQLFDHGVDAACVSFGIVMYLQVIRSGTTMGFYMLYISLTVNTYLDLYLPHYFF
jgi:ethanolaminephosphotransferase